MMQTYYTCLWFCSWRTPPRARKHKYKTENVTVCPLPSCPPKPWSVCRTRAQTVLFRSDHQHAGCRRGSRTIGAWGPTTCHSNFSTNSLAGIWGRCLPCRRRQPAASGRAPTTATANPWWDPQRATAWGHSRGLHLSWWAHREQWPKESSAGPEAQAASQLWGKAQPAPRSPPQATPGAHKAHPSPTFPWRTGNCSKPSSKIMHSQNFDSPTASSPKSRAPAIPTCQG